LQTNFWIWRVDPVAISRKLRFKSWSSFSHGWHLALKDQVLISDPIEAWEYGPVVRKLYNAFKKFGNQPITEKASDWQVDSRGMLLSCSPTIQSAVLEDDAYARAIVQSVWNKYGMLAPFKLVEITHLDGSPWQRARSKGDTFIPNDEIKAYFRGLATQGNGR